MSLNQILEKYKKKEPEIIFEWHDQLTEAKGWVVINSLKGGAAGGGTRMRKGLTKDEVTSLAKVMEIKFAVCGPPIGGAKSGIDFDPTDPRRTEVLERWYAAVFPLLKNYYGTGGDLNVDELKDVIPITEDLGLWHPQEGIVNGYLNVNKGERINILGQLRFGCAKPVENPLYAPMTSKKFAVADLITGFGVAESVHHFYSIFFNSNVVNKRVIVQGWGNVASAAGLYLARKGASIVGIIDRAGGVISEHGLTLEQVERLFSDKKDNALNPDCEGFMPFNEVNANIWDLSANIFIPGAASKIVTMDQTKRLKASGLELISCGANVPFSDDGVFFGDTANELDQNISLIPDFVANCGMARVFAYLMQKDVKLTDEAIFDDVSETIRKFLVKLHESDKDFRNISLRSLKSSIG